MIKKTTNSSIALQRKSGRMENEGEFWKAQSPRGKFFLRPFGGYVERIRGVKILSRLLTTRLP